MPSPVPPKTLSEALVALQAQLPRIPKTDEAAGGGHVFHHEPATDLFRCIQCHAYEITASETCAGEPPPGSEPLEVNAW